MAEEYSTRNKPSGDDSFLLKEDLYYLLMENGGKIVLAYGEEWGTRTKPS